MMQQSLGQFDTPLHAAGKRFHALFGAVGQAHARQNFCYALLQRRSAQPVQMSLMPQIFVGRQFEVDALRLKHDADLPPQRVPGPARRRIP